jgi:hypothetical protein
MVKPEREHEMTEAIARAEEEDDIEDSGQAYVRPQPPRRSAGDVYTFRLPKKRRDELREAAERHGVPPATLIRQWIELQLDHEAKQRAVASLVEGTPAGASPFGSWAHGTILGPIKDTDLGVLTENASDDQLASLMLLGSLVPDLTALGRDVHRRAMSALNDLSGALDDVIGLIGSTNLLTVLEVKATPIEGRQYETKASGKIFSAGLTNDNRNNQRHVVPNPNGGWDVRAPGAKRVSSRVKTKADAVRRAQEIVQNAGGGEVVIHAHDGRVRTSGNVTSTEDSSVHCHQK